MDGRAICLRFLDHDTISRMGVKISSHTHSFLADMREGSVGTLRTGRPLHDQTSHKTKQQRGYALLHLSSIPLLAIHPPCQGPTSHHHFHKQDPSQDRLPPIFSLFSSVSLSIPQVSSPLKPSDALTQSDSMQNERPYSATPPSRVCIALQLWVQSFSHQANCLQSLLVMHFPTPFS